MRLAPPELTEPYPLTEGDIAHFHHAGFAVLRGVCSPTEVKAYRRAILRATFALNDETMPLGERDAYRAAFLQTQNLRLACSRVARFVLAPRLARIAAELMGVEAVRVFHDQSLFKEPGAGANPTPWHQDQFYWPFAEPTTVGLWMPLVEVTADMGLLRYAVGSHRQGPLGDHAISEDSQAYFEAMLARQALEVVEIGPMAAGDACFHWGWTLHSATANRSRRLREAMVVTYYADGMRVGIPQNEHQEGDRVRFLGGRGPGELADHPDNPVAYRRAASNPSRLRPA